MRSLERIRETGIGAVVVGIAGAIMAMRVLVVVSIAIAIDVSMRPTGLQFTKPRGSGEVERIGDLQGCHLDARR